MMSQDKDRSAKTDEPHSDEPDEFGKAAKSDESPKSLIPKGVKVTIAVTVAMSVILVVGLVPFGILNQFTEWEVGIKLAVYGYVTGLVSIVMADRRTAAGLISALAVCVAIGTFVSGSVAIVALVIAVSTFIIPFYTVRGKSQPSIIAAMMISNGVTPATLPWNEQVAGTMEFYLGVIAIVLVGGLWGAVVGSFVKSKLPKSEGKPVPKISLKVALAGAIPLFLGTFLIAVVAGTHFPQYRWVWILAPVYSTMLARGHGTLRRPIDLMIGAVVGTALAAVVIQFSMPMMLELALGMIVISASIGISIAGYRYWISASVSTAGVIILTGAGSDPTVAAESRLLFGFFGAILALVLGAIVISCIRWALRSQAESNHEAKEDDDGNHDGDTGSNETPTSTKPA